MISSWFLSISVHTDLWACASETCSDTTYQRWTSRTGSWNKARRRSACLQTRHFNLQELTKPCLAVQSLLKLLGTDALPRYKLRQPKCFELVAGTSTTNSKSSEPLLHNEWTEVRFAEAAMPDALQTKLRRWQLQNLKDHHNKMMQYTAADIHMKARARCDFCTEQCPERREMRYRKMLQRNRPCLPVTDHLCAFPG